MYSVYNVYTVYTVYRRSDTILGFCGELCDLTKPLEPGSFMGTVKAKVNTVTVCTQCTGGRYDPILGFCGELCDLTKPVEPGSFMGTVKAKVNTVQCVHSVNCVQEVDTTRFLASVASSAI
jgi:hypothetical protein